MKPDFVFLTAEALRAQSFLKHNGHNDHNDFSLLSFLRKREYVQCFPLTLDPSPRRRGEVKVACAGATSFYEICCAAQ